MELQLDRRLANKRIYPAIDLTASSTRRDDLLLDKDVLQRMNLLRVYLTDMNTEEAMRELLNRITAHNLAGGWSNADAESWWQDRLPQLAAPLPPH